MAPNQTQETPFSLTCHWLEFLSLEGSATVKWSRQYVQFCTQENQRLETRHVEAEKPAFRTRLPPILTFSTHYQTGWNVTKCHACHAKRHDNLRGNIRKGKVLRLPPQTRRNDRKTRDSRRDTWEHQNEHFVRDFLQFSQLAT